MSRYAKQGMKASTVIVNSNKRVWKKEVADAATNSSGLMGAAKTEFIEDFDQSQTTQSNVKVLCNIIESTDPFLVIIPSTLTSDRNRRVLAGSSVLATRQVRNVLMYDVDLNNPYHQPNVFYRIKEQNELKMDCLRSYSRISSMKKSLIKTIQTTTRLHKVNARSAHTNVPTEAFQSHRMVLNYTKI
jgi:hypothetical protein